MKDRAPAGVIVVYMNSYSGSIPSADTFVKSSAMEYAVPNRSEILYRVIDRGFCANKESIDNCYRHLEVVSQYLYTTYQDSI